MNQDVTQTSSSSPVNDALIQSFEHKEVEVVQSTNQIEVEESVQIEAPLIAPFFSENVEKIKSEIQKLFVEEKEAQIEALNNVCPIIDETEHETIVNKLDQEEKPKRNAKCSWLQNGYLKIDLKSISQIMVITLLMVTCLWLINYFSVVPQFELQSMTESINDALIGCVDGFKNYFKSISYF